MNILYVDLKDCKAMTFYDNVFGNNTEFLTGLMCYLLS